MILKNSIFIFCIVILLAGSLFANDREEADENYKNNVNEFVNAFKEQMRKEYELEMIIWGGSFRDYFKNGIEFRAFRRATLE